MSITQGFDSSHVDKGEDYLNRWPFAQEIYRIATSACPKDWSVRIGIYGEWGTGKTCVLNFIEQMATADNHIIVSFNPWEFSDTQKLWQAFVTKIVSNLKPIITAQTEVTVGENIVKNVTHALLSNKYTTVLAKIADKSGFGVGTAISNSIDLLKDYFSFTQDEITELSAALGDRRIIIMVDDLDRASSEVVPELFYGLKQILDIKGFSFICAFDPVVVGQILGETHKGFGNGLKFLEKIIDYPRWLPQPSSDGLRKLAHANIDKYCAFVPKHALESIIPQLPQNPRAIKQYIRLLALLEPQISRHNPEELNWPVILLANVLKISFPQLAQDVVSDLSFWKEIDTAVMMHVLHRSDPDPIPPIIQSRVDKCKKISNTKLTCADSERLKDLLEGLVECSNFTVDKDSGFHYFLHIAEEPAPVTHREYETFLIAWKLSPNLSGIETWIDGQATRFSFKEDAVFSCLLTRTLNYRNNLLGKAANVPTVGQVNPLLAEVNTVFELLDQLVFRIGGVSSETKLLTGEHLNSIFLSFFSYIDLRSAKKYKDLRLKEEAFLTHLASDWTGDVTPIMKTLRALSIDRYALAGQKEKALYKSLTALISPRFAQMIIGHFHTQGFVSSHIHADVSNYETNQILLDNNGPFWRKHRREVYSLLACAKNELNVQLNIIDLLHHFMGVLKSYEGHSPAQAVEQILRNKRLSFALWKAATASPLNKGYVGGLREYPDIVHGFGVKLQIPLWWKTALKSLDRK